jgi:ABC-type branched-subunit amino acid transport system ATPase component
MGETTGGSEQRQVRLRTDGLTVRHGGVVALSRVTLEVRAGEIVGLIGPNGAGKSTFVDAVSGFVEHTGSVWVDGAEVSTLAPHDRARAGLARTWQSVELFDGLTVREQCLVAVPSAARFPMLADMVRVGRRSVPPQVDRALEVLGLADVADEPAATLPAGRQKLVGVARALAASPAVLLLDEPAAGLTTDESRALGETLRTLAADGPGLLLIEHDTDLVFDVCDRVVMLDLGSVVVEGLPEEVRHDVRVVQAYLGAPTERADRPE